MTEDVTKDDGMTQKTDTGMRKLDYVARKIAHWNRMGTPSQMDPETGAATPNWVIDEREKRRKKEKT